MAAMPFRVCPRTAGTGIARAVATEARKGGWLRLELGEDSGAVLPPRPTTAGPDVQQTCRAPVP